MSPMAICVTWGAYTKWVIVEDCGDVVRLHESGYQIPRLINHCDRDGSIYIDRRIDEH